MTEMHWIILGIALIIGVIVAWWLFSRGSKVGKPREHKPDVLDEGAAPARRNQALIDAPSAASQVMPPPQPAVSPRQAETVAAVPKPAPAVASAPVAEPVVVPEPVAELVPEPEAAAPVIEHAPEVQPTPAPAPAAPVIPAAIAPADAGDDLRKIKGLGPKLVVLLQSLGVTSIAQIAAWDEADIDRIDAQLGTFAGRIRRDSWVDQAKLLTSEDTSAYEAKFGKV